MASRWNAMDFYGMPWTLCYFHGISVEFYGIQVECHGIPWNAMDVMLFPWYISVELYGMECHGIQKIGTLTKLVSGCKPWKYMEFGHGLEYLIRQEVFFCFIF